MTQHSSTSSTEKDTNAAKESKHLLDIISEVKNVATALEHFKTKHATVLSTFRLSYERSDSSRNRLGVVGSKLAAIIPDAVDIVPKRTLPPREKGGKPIVLQNFPSVNEQTLFMYSVGATQELAQMLSELESQADDQMDQIASMYGEVSQLEQILSASSDGDAELRMREAATKAEIAKSEMEMEILRAKNEEDYADATRASEEEQLRRSEELTMDRLKREDDAARIRTERLLKAKFEASQRIEKTRSEAAEAVALIDHDQKLLLQKAAEEMKVKTARDVAKAKAEAKRANEDVHLRRLKAESEQRRRRNVADINAVFTHLSTSLAAPAKNPKQVLTFIGWVFSILSGT